MNFNASKCYSMSVTLSRNSIDTPYYLNGIPLSVVSHCKYLGIIIQSDLNWNKHVEQKYLKSNYTAEHMPGKLSQFTENP